MNSCNWFENILGYNEKKWNYDLNLLPDIITSSMGSFETKSIKELKESVSELFGANTGNKKLKVIFRKSKNKDNEKFFDTSAIQFKSSPGTMFQVASNFNCQELGSELRSVFSGKYITQLMIDTTQGPSASGGAVFGAFLRVGMHKQKEIDLLDKIPLKHVNGKLYNQPITKPFSQDLIKIGLHKSVRATFCRTDYNFEYNPYGPVIDQVYTSTCIFDNKKVHDYELANVLLEKAYEGTYLAAICRSSPKLVLTLIGGGAFQNPIELIIKNIMHVHNQYSKFLPKDCEIILPIYEPNRTDIEKHFKKFENVDIVWL